jgi:hypothetical protein
VWPHWEEFAQIERMGDGGMHSIVRKYVVENRFQPVLRLRHTQFSVKTQVGWNPTLT